MLSERIIQKLFILSFCLLFYTQPLADAAEFRISSETILRAFEREKAIGESFSAIPVYEYLSIGYGDPEYGGWSLHANGWGRRDLGDGEYYQSDSEGYLFDGYLQYSNHDSGFDVKLGRQHVYAGIINESVDGLGLKTQVGSYASLMVYGGLPVGYEDFNGRAGDSTYGSRLAFDHFFPGEVGLSYKHLSNDNATIDNKLGTDFSLFVSDNIALTGHSFWNFETDGWGEHSYAADVFLNRLSFKARYQLFQYQDYFSDGSDSQAFGFLQDTDEILTIVGGDVIWQQFRGFDAGLKLNHYTYDVRNETSQYAGLVFNRYGQAQTSVGAEAGAMLGDSPENNYLLGRVYFYWDAPFKSMENWFLDGEFMYVRYKEEIYGRDNSIYLSAGCGRELINDSLKLKISSDYSSDPYHDADFRFMSVLLFEY